MRNIAKYQEKRNKINDQNTKKKNKELKKTIGSKGFSSSEIGFRTGNLYRWKKNQYQKCKDQQNKKKKEKKKTFLMPS